MKPKKFELEVHQPYSTFTEGQPAPIPYLIDGLLPYAAFSVLGGKAKHGKSSMSRIEAVAIAKGQSFLDRNVARAETLLCSLEDPKQHVDNCLKVLDYDPHTDARIHIVSKLPHDLEETVGVLATFLKREPAVKFVVLDTLAKVIRATDSGSYDEMLKLCEQLHMLARESGVHIQALAHCKKIQPDDPFDGFLGSVEIRAETDTNIVLFDRNGKRLIQSETRMGTAWEATEIRAELAKIGESSMVKQFALGNSLTKTATESQRTAELSSRFLMKNRIVAALKSCGGRAVKQEDVVAGVQGNRQTKFEILEELITNKVIERHGVSHSKSNPLTLTLVEKQSAVIVPETGTHTSVPSQPESPLDKARRQLAEFIEADKQSHAAGHIGVWDRPIQECRNDVARLEKSINPPDTPDNSRVVLASDWLKQQESVCQN